ncbi:hypothetical protein BGZ80_008179, partial [Entomortierella chlamydospora]
IEPDDTVDDLKDAIKIKQSPSFNDTRASDLVLWIVTIPIGEDNEEEDDKPILLEDHLADAKKIRAKQAATEICKIFGSAPLKNTIHCIVQRPAAAP